MKILLHSILILLLSINCGFSQTKIFDFKLKNADKKKDSVTIIQKKNIDSVIKKIDLIDTNSVLISDLKENENIFLEIYNISLSDKKDSVHLFCALENSQGKKIINLAPPYNSQYKDIWTEIIEMIEGKEYPIKDFKVNEIRQDKAPPFITSFVLDYSGSMYGQTQNIEIAMEKVKKFVRLNQDEFDIIQFDHRIFNPVKLSKDTSDLTNLLPFNQLGWATALYNASFEGISNIGKSNKKRVAIIFTDGQDNSSFINSNNIIAEARNHGIQLFVIGYGSALKNILTLIAEQTGGKAYFPESLSELDDIFTEIYKAMNVHYVISYKIPKSKANRHDVTVKTYIDNCNCEFSTTRYYLLEPEPVEEDRIFHFALFDSGSAVVKKMFLPNLLKLAEYLKKHPGKKINIYGHTDSRGDSFDQKDLSLRRAHAVYNILARNGMDVDQVVNIEGYGFEKPIHKDDTCCEWKRHENRRVEIVFEN